MKTAKAPQTSVSRSAASIPALLLLGALSGTALAATDIHEPCPESADSADVLYTFIVGNDVSAPLLRAVDTTEPVAPTRAAETADDDGSDGDEAETAPAPDASTPAYTTRLPGVSAKDMPGFRRHMYRTDI